MFWYLLLGIVIGVMASVIGIYRLNAGTLKVFVPDDPEENPYLYVELNRPASFIGEKKFVSFRVDTQAINTRK